ncbi:tyrosine-protein phosphatase non-receptor type 23-like [Ischnura elegans]|uniref:tyrosine-protein phosphatase non-receptor type 23-like n=1 Tax=Ischnura elegans TaxID=197161 RepID=UPI001ED8960B|nr:tyrosine-protein phosphatase non-receptor type 23-like [Ischnura elegans]
MALRTALALVLIAAAACRAQQLGAGNYVDDYYDDGVVEQRPAVRQPPPAPVRGSAPAAPRPTPVPILKQINRHNEDGSYTYGYEGADGTFKIETKFPSGDVKGKYGFVDDTGKVRVVEYGADRYGFQPAGEGITVAPPTLVDETTEEDEPTLRGGRPAPRPAPRPVARPPPPPPAYEDEEVQYRPPPRSQGPTPPRALSVPGAAPAPQAFTPNFAPRPKAFAQQAPSQHFGPQQFAGGQQAARPAPQPAPRFQAQPAPRFQPAAQPAPRPQPQPAPRYQPLAQPAPRPQPQQQRASGLLDRLAKDYALPAGAGAPLHDISFGYY